MSALIWGENAIIYAAGERCRVGGSPLLEIFSRTARDLRDRILAEFGLFVAIEEAPWQTKNRAKLLIRWPDWGWASAAPTMFTC
jgi:hypothetical protein